MLVVLDANPIIGLSKGGIFHLLPRAFHHIYIPKPIWEEVVERGNGRPGQMEAEAGRADGWLQVTTTTVPASFRHDYQLKGNDAYVAKLAVDLRAHLVVTDDKKLRRAARSLGFNLAGTAALVAAFKQLDFIPSCRDVLDRMIREEFGIEQIHYDSALLQSGEA